MSGFFKSNATRREGEPGQALGIKAPIGALSDIKSFEDLVGQEVKFAAHCFGCTAGAGSSCGGSLVN